MGTYTACNLTLNSTLFDSFEKFSIEYKTIPKVKKIIYHDPATIVFWEDGTKTVVKRMEDQEFSKYYGFLAALAKKCYGNNSKVQRIIERNSVVEE